MKVGSIVQLKFDCLSNPPGALGVVFNNYGTGFQAIFENGEYDGFSMVHEVGGTQVIESEYFLRPMGFCQQLENYKFTNVMRLSDDFKTGEFNSVFMFAERIRAVN